MLPQCFPGKLVSKVMPRGETCSSVSCDPGRCRVPQRVRRDTFEARSVAGRGEALLDIADSLPVNVKHVPEIGSSLPSSAEVRQEARRNWNHTPLLIGRPSASNLEINTLGLQVSLWPA